MALRNSLAVSAAAGLALTAAATAQPTSTDLGTLANGTLNVPNISIGTGQVVWYRFTVSAPVNAARYLDIDSEGSFLAPSNDTEIGLYDSIGNLVASDDDSGSNLLSNLSFGSPIARPPVGNGAPYNGRNGSLPAGTYYLSISGYNSAFGATGWNVTSPSTNTGTGNLNLALGSVTLGPGQYVEPGEAGDVPSTAAVTTGAGSLTDIFGTLGTSDADMYKIQVCDAGGFSATSVGGTTIDTVMCIFRADGTGVAFNDDEVGGTTLQSRLTSAFVTTTGLYYVAVAQFNKAPQSAGQNIWINDGVTFPYRSERAPDGPGAAGAVDGWSVVTGTGGGYRLAFTGACFAQAGQSCYANCDGSTQNPFLNVLDFNCFLNRFTAGDSYANCDASTQPPILNVLDFNCFLNRFTAGCSAP